MGVTNDTKIKVVRKLKSAEIPNSKNFKSRKRQRIPETSQK